jgi:succinylglutamate desuccinylase
MTKNMNSRETFHGVIEYNVRLGVDLPTTIANMKSVYGAECPSDTTISTWRHYYRRGGEGTCHAPISGRP